MGALTYAPAFKRKNLNASVPIQIESLVSIAQDILNKREQFNVSLGNNGNKIQRQ